MPRAGAFIPLRDRKTGKSYQMPWEDVTTKPTPQQARQFIDEQENPSLWQQATGALFKPLAHIGKPLDDLGESLLKYSEGESLSTPEGLGGFKSTQIAPKLGKGEKEGWGRTAARYGGAFAQSLGEQVDSLASPGGLALAAAPGAGKLLQAGRSIPAVGGTLARIGTGVARAPQAAGAAFAAHGANKIYEDIQDPNATWGDVGMGAVEAGAGYLGARYGGPKARGSVVEPVKPPSYGSSTSTALDDFGLNNWGSTTHPQGTGRAPLMGEGLGVGRPSSSEWIHDSPSQPAPPVGPHTSEGLIPQPDFRVPLPKQQVPPSPLAPDPPYIQEIKQTFDDAMGRPGRGRMPLMGEQPRLEKLAQEAERTRQLQAEVEAENAAAGFKPSKPRAPKKAVTAPSKVQIEDEGLRYPQNESRLKYPKKMLDDIDYNTLENPETVGNHEGLLSDIRKRLGIEPKSTASDMPARQSWKNARFGKDRPRPETRRQSFKSARGSTSIFTPGIAPEGSPWAAAEDVLSGGWQKAKGAVSSARQKALTNIADAEATGVFGSATTAVEKARKAAAALTGPDVTGVGKGFGSFLKSGWAHLEGMGEPGKQLARLLKRERIDAGIEKAAAEKGGGVYTDAEGTPINRTGKVIYDRNKERIEDLLGQITDPEDKANATALVKEFAGQFPKDKSFSSGVEKIKALQGLTKLSQFGIGNVAGSVPVAMRNKIGTTLRAAAEVIPGNKARFAKAFEKAQESGQLGSELSTVMADTGAGGVSKLVDKLYRISGSEKRMRTMATLAGRDTAQELFAKLKAKPASKMLRKQLDDLILEDDIEALLKQDKLSDLQVKRAGGRMNELTQGLAEGIDLPPQWKNYDLATQFKKFSFMQTRNMKEALKANPGRTLAAGLIAAPILGEATGDVKAIIKGGTKHVVEKAKRGNEMDSSMIEDIAKEIEGRGKGIGRYGQNMNQAWALGILGDVAKGVERGPSGLAEVLGGPTIGDIGEAAYGGHQLATKGQSYHLQRQAARLVPFIGTGLAASIKGSYKGRQRKRSREKRSRN